MEESELSTPAQDFLIKSRIEGVISSSLGCIGVEHSELNSEENIKLLKKTIKRISSKLPLVKYLNESTTYHSDPKKSADKAINKGNLSQGVRIKIETPMNWVAFSKHSRSVRYKIQAWGGLDAILNYDSIKNNKECYIVSYDHVLDWINTFILDPNEDEFAWYDMAVGQRATKIAYLFPRAIKLKENIEDIAAMIVAAETHIIELMQEDKLAEHSNHGLFQMAGLLALGKSLPFLTRSSDACIFAMEKIKAMLKNHFTEDFLHKEHSPMYHIFMTNYIAILLDSGFMNDSEDFVKLAKGAIEAAKWFAQPDGTILPFGDTPNIPIVERTNFELNKYRNRANAPEGLKYFNEGGLVIHSHYSKSKGPVGYLAFNGGFHSRQHKHADDFNIQLFNDGIPLLVDPGTFTYQYNLPERMYVESTRAHNCLEIDDLNYSRFRNDIYGSAIDYAGQIGGCILIDAQIYRKNLIPIEIPNNKIKTSDSISVNINHCRKVIYRPGNFLVIIDNMTSKEEHSYRQWFKINQDLTIKSNGSELLLSLNRDPVAKIVNISSVNTIIESFSGNFKSKLQGWVSTDGHTLEKANSVSVSAKGSNCVIATVIDLKPTKKATYFFNSGTNGKYIRFSIKRRKERFNFISRTTSSGTDITYNEKGLESKISY